MVDLSLPLAWIQRALRPHLLWFLAASSLAFCQAATAQECQN